MNKKLSDKDLKDWKDFVKSKEKVIPKENDINFSLRKNSSTFVIDLHGFSLDQANKFVEKTIKECFEKQISKINIITGKGLRSKSVEDPYKSSELSILRNSIPKFISSHNDLMKLVMRIENENQKNSGSFDVYLRSKNKFR